jgi:hypothetical protein
MFESVGAMVRGWIELIASGAIYWQRDQQS